MAPSLLTAGLVHVRGASTSAAYHRVGAHVRHMPHALKPNEKQHEHPKDHPVVTQFDLALRMHVAILEDMLKANQVKKYTNANKPPKAVKRSERLAYGVSGVIVVRLV